MDPFGERLRRLLEELQPPRTQKWLADASGVSAPTISRLIQGTRSPDTSTIEALAPVLGVDPEQLVLGTDAASRLEISRQWVRRREYDAALERVLAVEARAREADFLAGELAVERARRDKAAASADDYLRQLQDLQRQLDHELNDNRRRATHIEELKLDNTRARRGLERAVLQIHKLGKNLEQAQAALEQLGKTSTLTKWLAGLAAGAATFSAVKLMTMNPTDPEESDADR
ncbi:MAG: helix-turn-helix transcriptional regulator [Deltaproteobacteria bacterium]|nr:helix-turn-helix transcriptional regulator [Deltaproteobacteria bacterium]